MNTDKCPTCGSTLHVETSKEGTSFFIPVDVEAIDELAEKLAAYTRMRGALEEINGLLFRDSPTHPVSFFADVSKIVKRVLSSEPKRVKNDA